MVEGWELLPCRLGKVIQMASNVNRESVTAPRKVIGQAEHRLPSIWISIKMVCIISRALCGRDGR